jgi:hypothetical protein
MPAAQYLERARECADLADRAETPEDRKKLMEIAKAWADLPNRRRWKPRNNPEGQVTQAGLSCAWLWSPSRFRHNRKFFGVVLATSMR